MPSEDFSYQGLIKEVFLDPIRSVVIVDDDYPTWEEILGESDSKVELARWKEKGWHTNKGEVASILKAFRARKPSLIIDFHDGFSEGELGDEGLSSHLHQSDLLVLDYNLNGTDGGGEKAINIVKGTLKNPQFNLIVFHTGCEDLRTPFLEVVIALLGPCGDQNAERISEGAALLETKADEGDGDIADDIRDAVTSDVYAEFRRLGTSALRKFAKGEAPFANIQSRIAEAGWTKSEPTAVLCWAISEFERITAQKMGDGETTGLSWTSVTLDGLYWIRTKQGFITFAQKGVESDLLFALQSALVNWGPTPSRLLSAKLRSELDRHGAIAEDRSLSKRQIYAKFYQELLACDGAKRTHMLQAQIDRYVEHLVSGIMPNLVEFGEKIIESDPIGADGYIKHYNVNFGNKEVDQDALLHYNSHVSCVSFSGWHLRPGHIISVEEQLWICLSPACDMVPGQKIGGIDSEKGSDKRSFMAAALFERKGDLDRYDVNSNNFVFLNSGSKIETYTIYESENSGPKWRLFIASNDGRLNEKKVELQSIKNTNGELSFESAEAEIVGQLRYEYALNLIQKLGANFTRIGLDFVAPPG